MLTPRFKLKQTETEIILTVHAPYANVAETEIYVHENDVRFHSSPYYLRLNLPGWVEENDGSRAIFDADSGDFVIRLGKVVPGEYFPDLDMITKLLAPKHSSTKIVPEISVVGSPLTDCAQSDSEDEEMQWFFEQVPEKEDDSNLNNKISYGFANAYSSVFKKIESEIPRLVDLPEPDLTSPKERDTLRMEDELLSFNEGHYLADMEDAQDKSGAICAAIAFKGPWETEPEKFESLSEENINVLKDLPNKEYIMDSLEKTSCYLGIIDLIFAYAYDQRTTDGEGTVESGWTIAKLSPMLSWLQMFGSLDDLVTSCIRRSLCFPLYRHWDLSLKVLKDTQKIMRLGKSGILKCLLNIHSIFNSNDPQYILNQLFIRDYCIWIQKASVEKIKSLAEALDKFSPKKEDLGLGLKELEALMDGRSERTDGEDKIVDVIGQKISKLSIVEKLESRDSDDTTMSDGSSSDTSDSEDSNSSEDKGCAIKISGRTKVKSGGRDSDDTSTSGSTDSENNSSDDESEECAIKISGS